MTNLFIDELNSYRDIINKAIEKNNIQKNLNIKKFPSDMEPYISSFFKYCRGGKRLRAYLVKLGYEICTNEYDSRIVLPSISYELFHTGVLIHDDIIDQGQIRRNMPTMHVAFGNNHLAMSKAICVGDIGILFSIDMISQSDFSDNIIKKAINHQNKVFEVTILGELKDIELSEKSMYTFDDIIEMYKLKTSWYSIIGPMQLGAILGDATQEILDQIERIGLAMGIAFQIKDDILGIFGAEDTIGKSNLSDMQEGKKTVLTKHFIDNATDKNKELFNKIYGNLNSGTSELQELRRLFISSNTYEYSTKLCEKYIDDSKKILSLMNIDAKYKEIITNFLDYLQNRRY